MQPSPRGLIGNSFKIATFVRIYYTFIIHIMKTQLCSLKKKSFALFVSDPVNVSVHLVELFVIDLPPLVCLSCVLLPVCVRLFGVFISAPALWLLLSGFLRVTCFTPETSENPLPDLCTTAKIPDFLVLTSANLCFQPWSKDTV